MNGDKNDMCDYCNKALKTSRLFSTHMGLMHTQIKYDCSTCNKVVHTKPAQSNHVPEASKRYTTVISVPLKQHKEVA